MIQFQFNCYNVISQNPTAKFMFSRGNYDDLRTELSRVNWDDVVKTGDTVNNQWLMFASTVMDAMKTHIPKFTPKQGNKRKYLTPLDKNAIAKIKKKHRAWKRFMNSRESKDYKSFCSLRNQVKQMTRKARIEYEKEIAADAKKNPKKFWNFTKSQTKTREGIANLKVNETTTTSDEEKADFLLNQFTSVFTNEPAGEIPAFDKDIEHEVTKVKITTEMVEKRLKNLNISKSSGPDGLHPRVLSELSDIIAPPLTNIFNASLEQKSIPDDWKMAIVSPIYKKGSKQKPENYRPVSLTCIASKIMESFIRDHIIAHMKINNLLSKKQFGFLHGRSTVLQLLKVLDNWVDILDKPKSKIDNIYMDFQKAFDKVPHQRLLSKLAGYGFTGEIRDWVQAFLSNRKHRVCVNGKLSPTADVTSGIPQGSVLGPVLFVLYINDLPEEVQNEVFLFADDTKVYSQITDATDAENLQSDLKKLQDWSEKWLLPFHPDKCKVLHLGAKSEEEFEYTMGETTLEETTCEKDLGVNIDNRLTFSNHINAQVNKANSIMGIIRRSFRHLTAQTFTILFKSLVRPHLEYAAPVWNPHLKKEIKKIERVQRRATKQVPELKNMSYKERLQKLKLPTMLYRRMRGDMIETFKILTNKYDADAVAGLLPLHRDTVTRDRTRGHSLKLSKRDFHYNRTKFSFTRRVVDMWNNLPQVVISAPTVNTFKNRLDALWSKLDVRFDFDTALARMTPDVAAGGINLDLCRVST